MAEITTAGPDTAVAAPAPAAPDQAAPKPDLSLPPEIAGRRAAADAARRAAERWGKSTEIPAAPAAEPPAEPLPPAAVAEPKVDAQGKLHGEDGKYIDKSLPASGEAPEPQAVATPPAEPAEPVAPPAPQTVRIFIPEGDIRRAAGGLEYADVDPKLAQFINWNLNNAVRRQEGVVKDQTIRELRQKLAQTDATTVAQEKFKATPQYAAHKKRFDQFAALEEAGEVEPGTAQAYWEGAADADFKRFLEGEVSQRMETVTATEEQEAAESWYGEALQRTSGLRQEVRALPEFRDWFDKAAISFDANMSAGLYDHRFKGVEDQTQRAELAHELFKKHFLAILGDQPAVRAVFERQRPAPAPVVDPQAEERKLAQARRDGEEALKRRVADARAAAPPNPLAALPATPRPATADQPPKDVPDANASGFALEKLGREKARQAALKYMPQRR